LLLDVGKASATDAATNQRIKPGWVRNDGVNRLMQVGGINRLGQVRAHPELSKSKALFGCSPAANGNNRGGRLGGHDTVKYVEGVAIRQCYVQQHELDALRSESVPCLRYGRADHYIRCALSQVICECSSERPMIFNDEDRVELLLRHLPAHSAGIAAPQ
jgi:hypothetical protein